MNRTPKNPETEIAIEGLGVFKDEFIVSRREEISALYEALTVNDFQIVHRACHTWRGFAIPYGFGELALLAQELEAACDEKDNSQCVELLKQIENYLSSK